MRARTAALLILAVSLHLAILLAGFIAPYDAAEQDRELPYAPPTPLHFRDGNGFHWRPFVRAWVLSDDEYREGESQQFPVRFFVTGNDYTLLGVFHFNLHLIGVDTPGRISILGTDGFRGGLIPRIIDAQRQAEAGGTVA